MLRLGNHSQKSLIGVATAALGVPALAIAVGLYYRQRKRRTVPPRPKTALPPPKELQTGAYDVVIVGAGPAGATLAYFLAKQQQESNKKKLKILLLERKKFPRVKYCGDAWCAQALDLLETMEWSPGVSILEELERNNLVRSVKRGGFVSPFGHVCINQGEGDAVYGSSKAIRTYAIKRVIIDEYIARAAERAGAELREESEADIPQISFSSTNQHWTVPIKGDIENSKAPILARFLVAADGATSYLARHLGVVHSDPDSTCSHRYVVGGTHNFQSDGVMFFNRAVLPGYSAIFRHSNDDMYLGTYILPGGKATSRCIPGFEEELVNKHPYVKAAFHEKSIAETEWRVDPDKGENGRLKTAPIRCGGEKSFGDHFLVVGDASGQTDPMTGEGIHTAMIAATLAADTIQEMFDQQHFSEDATQVYHERWMESFGNDFKWSAAGTHLIYHFPILLDAACAYGITKGQWFLDEFGKIMTGVKPKSAFLDPTLSIPISYYLVREIFLQYIWGRKPLLPPDIGKDLVNKQFLKKTSSPKKT